MSISGSSLGGSYIGRSPIAHHTHTNIPLNRSNIANEHHRFCKTRAQSKSYKPRIETNKHAPSVRSTEISAATLRLCERDDQHLGLVARNLKDRPWDQP